MTDVPSLDPAALRAKYREERDKRLRPEGIAQYLEPKGRFAHFGDDPYVAPGFTRAPLHDEVDVALIGAGFGGLLAGARLRQLGVRGLVFFGNHSSDGRLYEIADEAGKFVADVIMESLVAYWSANAR